MIFSSNTYRSKCEQGERSPSSKFASNYFNKRSKICRSERVENEKIQSFILGIIILSGNKFLNIGIINSYFYYQYLIFIFEKKVKFITLYEE